MPESGGLFTFRIDASDAGKRVDVHLAALIPDLSRSLAADLLRRGDIRVLGEVKKPGYRLRIGDEISGRIPPPEPTPFRPEPIPLHILHEDADLIVLNKPPGLVVHPSPGHASGTLVNGLLRHCPDLTGIGGERRPGIVHRLDKDTSGVLAVAKTAAAQARLAAQFKDRAVRKEYFALAYGRFRNSSGVIDAPVARHPTDRKRMSVQDRGRPAKTLWRVLESYDGMALLHLRIETGRTHQIRVHCAFMGRPVVGDPVYGGRKPPHHLPKAVADKVKGVHRQMLHAWRLTLRHPRTAERLVFTAPPPSDMDGLIALLRRSSGLPEDAPLPPIKPLDNA